MARSSRELIPRAMEKLVESWRGPLGRGEKLDETIFFGLEGLKGPLLFLSTSIEKSLLLL